jgi:pimeloyl-ACP methyl ester carboxylesterase
MISAVIGFQEIHPHPTLNFMLNRMAVTVDEKELAEFSKDIVGLDDWIEAALEAADAAERDSRKQAAATYFRGAEFYMAPSHPRKAEAYEKFMTFFSEVRPEVADLRTSIPYEGGKLGVIDIPAVGEEKDVIVACSGFDGLIEEMYAGVLPLAEAGYRVVLYEGPGQGSALRWSHLPMIYNWEKPVAAVLDHLEISSCTLLGVSLGGYLAPRAAAFEPRAKRLIAWGSMYDFFDCYRQAIGDEAFTMLSSLVHSGNADVVNQVVTAAMKEDATARWAVTHGIHTCGGETPYDFMKWATELNLKDVSTKIKQDTLILAGSKDHLVPVEQTWQMAGAFTNANSITVRMFTEYEDAAEHCQVANRGVVIDEILRWLEALRKRDAT